MALPALRNIDAFPIEHEGETMIVVRDPEAHAEDQLILSPVAFFVASQLDGTNDVSDIQYLLFHQTGGQIVPEENVRQVVDYLDDHGFLATPRFEEIYREAVERFSALAARPAYLAGKSYPEDTQELRAFIDAMFRGENGPGRLPAPETAGETGTRCLLAPHIDFARGGHAYAHAYLRMSEGRKPDTALIFGVSHSGPPAPFMLCRKGYETPFGTLEADAAAVDALAGACAWDPFEHEIAHRTEHSIEFQAVMLGYLYGTDVKIAPILCGPLSPGYDQPADPEAVEGVGRFLDACRDLMRASNGAMAVIAGVDLAHVGPRFGDAFEIDDSVVERVRARDDADLAHALGMDAARWYASVMEDDNERRVCGLNAVYAALRTLDGAAGPGELLKYGYAHDPAGGIVSFAGAAFPDK